MHHSRPSIDGGKKLQVNILHPEIAEYNYVSVMNTFSSNTVTPISMLLGYVIEIQHKRYEEDVFLVHQMRFSFHSDMKT